MAKPYIRQEDCHQRLNDTICTYENLPVFVLVNMDFPVNNIHICPLHVVAAPTEKRAKATKIIHVADPLFSVYPVELGYVQARLDTVCHLKRLADRRTKQGLSINSVKATVLPPSSFFYSECMTALWTDKYDSFQHCLDNALRAINGNLVGSWCFNRHACVSAAAGSIFLEFQENAVAKLNLETLRFEFIEGLKGTSFLRIILQEQGVPV